MNWKDVGKIVGGFAPEVGALLGGPLGGIAGTIIGGFLGLGGGSDSPTITPEVLADAISKGGDAVIELIKDKSQEIVAQFEYLTEGLKQDAAQGQAINETMRAEIAAGVSFWHWRNLLGYAVLAWVIAPLPLVTWAVYHNDASRVTLVITLATAFMGYFTMICALLGYVAGDTTRRITTAITGDHAPTIISAIAGAFAKKK